MKFNKVFLFSLIIHIIIFVWTIKPIPPISPPQKPISSVKEIRVKIQKYNKRAEHDCDYYIGIGLKHDNIFHKISEIVEHGPADRAGIREGDILVMPFDNDKLKEGQIIKVTITRLGINITYKIKVERICKFENKKSED